jgi:outer membrane receptor protein involved in Fe transport
MTMSRARLLAAASAFAMCAGPAMAQEASAIEEIVVTAQKTQQAAIDVPISLTAYGAERLESLGIQDFADLSLFTPGFEVQDQSPNNPGFVMRGITSDSTDSYSEARVSVFQDGVSISKAQGSYVELFDLERVEVAKGPQSTLFGRGALIGGVNIIQKKASTEGFDAYFKVEGGSHEYKMGEAAVNAPIGEHAALRLSGRIKARDGFVKNALGGDAFQSQDTSAFRAALRLEPSDRVAFDLIANYQKDEPTGTSFKSGGFRPTDPTTGQVLGDTRPQSAAALAAPANFEKGKLGVDRMVTGYTGIGEFKLTDAWTLNSISAYRRYDSEEVFDPDGTSLAILTGLNDARGEQWSQEFRLNYDNGGRFRGFVGGDVFKAKDRQRVPLQFDERIGLAVVTGQFNAGAAGLGLPADVPAPAAVFGNTAFTGALLRGLVAGLSGNRVVLSPAQATAIAANLRSNHIEETNSSSDLDSFDVFADGTFKATDKLEISAGVRFTRDDKTTGFGSRVVGGRSVLGGAIGAAQIAASGSPAALAQAQAILGALSLPTVQQIPASALPLFGVTFQPTTNNGDVAKQDLKDDGVTWRVVARYAATDDANLYASFARGRRPEVLAASGPAAPGTPPRFGRIEAETVDSYEAGAKLALLDRRLRLDMSAYRYDYDNFQTVEQQGTLFVTTNAGKAKAYGFEGQADWAVTSNLDLLATYAYSHARFASGAYDGNRFRLSPDHSVSVAASFRVPALGGEIEIRPSYTWQSKVFFDDTNDLPAFQTGNFVPDKVQDEFQKAYGLVNLRVSWSAEDSPITLEAFATNLADEDYIIDAGNTGDSLGLPTFISGAPRMVGVGVTYRY